MIFLKRNKITVNLFFLFLSGCVTSSFKIVKQHELATVIKVTPDRVLLGNDTSTTLI